MSIDKTKLQESLKIVDLEEEYARKHLQKLNLSSEELEYFSHILSEIEKYGHSPTYDKIFKDDWRTEPVSAEEFINNPHYMGALKDSLRPGVLKDFLDIFSGVSPCFELILAGSLRWGKSYLTALVTSYLVYKLSCLKNPQKYLGLSPVSSVYIINLSVTGDQASEGIFADFRNMIDQSPYFKTRFPFKERKGVLTFPKNIIAKSGNSSEFSAIGKNVFIGIIDEANFFGVKKKSARSISDTGEYDAAKTLYEALVKRIRLTYSNSGVLPGMGIISSSARYPQDFIETKIRFLNSLKGKEEDDGSIKVYRHSVWEVNDPSLYSQDKFYVAIGDQTRSSKILKPDEIDTYEGRKIQVPGEFKTFFLEDLDNAIRDIAGISTPSISPFFPMREKVASCFIKNGGWEHPFENLEHSVDLTEEMIIRKLCIRNQLNKYRPIYSPEKKRGIAVDLAKGKVDKGGDYVGFAMGHISGFKKVMQQDVDKLIYTEILKPVIRMDLVMRIRAISGDEIDQNKIISLIEKLRMYGFHIAFVVADQYQSASFLKTLSDRGYNAFQKSSRMKEFRPYQFWKRQVLEGRWLCYDYPPLRQEMIELEDKEGYIDHPDGGHNDISDAVANMVDELEHAHINRSYSMEIALSDSELMPMKDQIDLENLNQKVTPLEDPIPSLPPVDESDIEENLRKMVSYFIYQNIPIPWDNLEGEENYHMYYLLDKERKISELEGKIQRSDKLLKELMKVRANKFEFLRREMAN